MRKLYSLVLIATALLIGTNAWAQSTISLEYYGNPAKNKGFTDLQTAFDYVAPGDSATITILEGFELPHGILMPHLTAADVEAGKTIANVARQRICLDLAGYELTIATDEAHFALMKGLLHIKSTGEEQGLLTRTADKGSDNWHRGVIVVSGADGNNNPTTENPDRSQQEWSTLYIDNNVKVSSTGNNTYGIGIQDLGSSSTKPNWNGFVVASIGYETKQGTNGNMWNTPGMSAQWSAFGVKIVIDGVVYGDVRGINILGNINQTPSTVEPLTVRGASYPFYTHYYPYVKIAKNANVSCRATGIIDNGNGGIYAGGWAIIDIEGYVHGQTGVTVKAGDITVKDGTVKSDDPNFSGNGNYHGTVGGNAIFVTSDKSYAGDTHVTIEGDSKITGKGGSAITEVLAANQTTTNVQNIDIKGGTIEGGNKGAIAITSSAEQNEVVTIYGANVQGENTVAGETVPVTDFAASNTHTTTVTVGGKTTIVVSTGAAPTGYEHVYGNPKDSVKWKHLDESVEAMEETLPGNLTLKELEINQSYNQTLTIPEGVTLTVGHVVLGEKAQIIVAPGAKFIVNGNQGIIAPVASNIILQYNSAAPNGGKYATFVFDPNVTSNRHPNATVEFTSKSWRESSTAKQWEWFGVPTYNAVKSIAASCLAYVAVYENGDWQDIGLVADISASEALRAKLNKPFAAYDLLANRARTAAAPTITITGELVGNVNATLNAYQKWNPFANSYTAEVDAEAFVNGLSENIADAIYLAKQNNNGTITWNLKTDEMLEDLKLQPMQAFLLLNNGDTEEASINYTSMVYNPATIPSNNGAPRRSVENTTKVTINVANENGTWDDVDLRENGKVKSLEKYMNDDVNIYVVDGEKNDYVAAEDLENTYVGFSTVNGGNFTISFAKAEGREFDLIDLETGARVAVSEGETYSFSAAANSANDYRFKLVAPAKMPTAIENTEVKANAKGIFTLTGQFLGEMNVWNTLPAGVYVVNGAKLVK